MNNKAALSLSIWTLLVLLIASIIIVILIFLVKTGILSNLNILSSLFNSSQARGISNLVGVQTTFTPYNCSSTNPGGCVVFNHTNEYWWAYYDGINQSQSLSGLNSAITFTTSQGNFQLIAYPIDSNNMFYCAKNSNTYFKTQGSYDIDYYVCGVTFVENGLPEGYFWTVQYNNTNYSSSSVYLPVIAASPGKYIIWNDSNSSFNSQLSAECTTTYTPDFGVGYNSVPGSYVNIYFSSSTKCERIITKFVESGLPVGYKWEVDYNNTLNYSNSNIITFSTMSGPHTVYIPELSNSSNNCTTIYTPQYSSPVTAGSTVYVDFINVTRCLTTFIEQNLPPGYKWTVKYDNSQNSTFSGSYKSNVTINATLTSNRQFTANAYVSGLYCAPSNNNVLVLPGKTYDFNSWLCNSTFNETGLPTGTKWNITYDGIYLTSTSHIIKFIDIPSSSSKLQFTAYKIPETESSSSQTTTFSIVGYGYSSGSTLADYNLPGGASLYLCNGGDGYGVLSSYSWTSDSITSPSYASVGHQSTSLCSDSSKYSYIVVGGVAINTNVQYSLQSDVFNYVNSFSYSYSESQNSDVIISISCGWYECNSITIPSGCQQLFYKNGNDNWETTYMAVCYNQGAGTYSLSGYLNGQGSVAIGVYSFPISTTSSSTTYYYYPRPSSGYNYTGLNETINYSSTLKLPSNILYYIPITITNNQNQPTPAPFQQIINISNSLYSGYADSNFQNVEFFSSSGQPLYSWLESYSYPNNAIYWVKLNNSIPAHSSVTIYMGFASSSTNLLNNQNDGEAPQLSPTYGEYDDGPNVFDAYWNFNDNLNSFTPKIYAGSFTPTAVSNNPGYIELMNDTGGQGTYILSPNILPLGDYIIQTLWYYSGVADGFSISLWGNPSTIYVGGGGDTPGMDGGLTYHYEFWSGSGTPPSGNPNEASVYSLSGNNAGTFITSAPAAGQGTNYVYSQIALYDTSSTGGDVALYSSTLSSFENIQPGTLYNPTYQSNAAFSIPLSNSQILFGSGTGGGASYQYLYWSIIRAYPPNGVMPSVSFGSIQSNQPGSTGTNNIQQTQFYESGLSQYSGLWNVNYEGQLGSANLGSSILISSVTQTGSASAYLQSYNCQSSLSNVIPGSSYTFSSWSCITTFSESGLPSSWNWCVNYDNQQTCSTSSSISFNLPAGIYSYYIDNVAHSVYNNGCYYTSVFQPSPSSGSSFSGGSVSVSYSFSGYYKCCYYSGQWHCSWY